MNLQDAYYHGIRQQVRRVLESMTDLQIEKGLTAFVDGASTWSHCFFARALRGDTDLDRCRDPEQEIMRVLKINSPIPVRIVYCTFDGLGVMKKDELMDFIKSRGGSDLDVSGIDYSKVEQEPIVIKCGPKEIDGFATDREAFDISGEDVDYYKPLESDN